MDSKPLYTKITVPNGQQCHLEPQEEGLTQEASRPRACCVLVHVAQTALRVPPRGPGCTECPPMWPRLPCVSSPVWPRPVSTTASGRTKLEMQGLLGIWASFLCLYGGRGGRDRLFFQFCLSKAEKDPTQVPALPVLSSWDLLVGGSVAHLEAWSSLHAWPPPNPLIHHK